MIRVIIAGTRTFSDYNTLCSVVDSILKMRVYAKGYTSSDVEIVCGMAKGADKLGERYAKANNIKVAYFPAEWEKYGKAAGYHRNKEMAEYASYKNGFGALIAFWDGKSKGTKMMIELANQHGLRCFIYDYINSKMIG